MKPISSNFLYSSFAASKQSWIKGVISSLRKDLQSLSSKTITFDSGQIQTAVNDVKELKMAFI